jgi:hypothetical protein
VQKRLRIIENGRTGSKTRKRLHRDAHASGDSTGDSASARESPGREKPRVRPARPNHQPHLPGALWAISLVRRLLAIDVHPRVDVATDEMNADEPPAGCFDPAGLPWFAREIDMFANHD